MKTADIARCIISGILIALLVFIIQRGRGFGIFHCLSDACFSSGVLMAGAGGLLFAASKGFFDIMFYSVHSLFTVTFRRARTEDPVEYIKKRNEKRAGFLPELVTGLFFILLSVFFLILS